MAAVAAGVLLGMYLGGKPRSGPKEADAAADTAERAEDIRAGEAAMRAEMEKKASQAEQEKKAAAAAAAAPPPSPAASADENPSSEPPSKGERPRQSRRKTRLTVSTSASSFGPRVILRANADNADNADNVDGAEGWTEINSA